MCRSSVKGIDLFAAQGAEATEAYASRDSFRRINREMNLFPIGAAASIQLSLQALRFRLETPEPKSPCRRNSGPAKRRIPHGGDAAQFSGI